MVQCHHMKKLLLINKPRGVTPLQVVQKIKQLYPEYQSLTMSYAGRLDPMAEGLLLLLNGDENKKRASYEALEKEYSFDVLFGLSSDTYDVLGRLKKGGTYPSFDHLSKQLEQLIPTLLGEQLQPYPPFSSFHVKNKPLFYWAREGKLSEITIPQKKITIHSLSLLSLQAVRLADTIPSFIEDLKTVQGDFRQEEIINDWQNLLRTQQDIILPLATFTVTCTSGTYVRSLAHRMGTALGYGALATRIQRTRVGNYLLKGAINIGP